jgi:uncharacterized membrane protein YkvA (DUF1232 family)
MTDLVRVSGEERLERRFKMKSLIFFLPNLLKLLYRLLLDARVSRADKAVLAATIIYAITPLDFIPDFIPFIGQVDDVYLVAIAVLRIINRTSEEVVEEHWNGGVNIKRLVTSISNLSQFFLPARLRNILTGRLDRPAQVADFDEFTKKRGRDQKA